MLHIVKQFISGLTMGVKLKNSIDGGGGDNSLNLDAARINTSDNQDLIKMLKSYDITKDNKLSLDDFTIDGKTDFVNENNLVDLLKKIGVPHADIYNDGISIESIVSLINEGVSSIGDQVEDTDVKQKTFKAELLSGELPKIISDFSCLNISEYANFKYNETVKKLQEFLINESLLPREQKPGKSSADGKWGTDTKEAYNNYLRLVTEKADNELFYEEEKIIAEFDVNTDTRDKQKVLLLQKALVKLGYNLGNTGGNKDGVDGGFYRKDGQESLTQKAFKKAEKSISDKIKASQDGNSITGVEETQRHSDIDKVKDQVETTKQSVEDLKNKLLITSGLNKELEDIFFDRKKGYSIQKGLEALFGDKYEGLVNIEQVQTKEELLAKNEEKITAALEYIAPARYNTQGEKASKTHRVVDHILKATPWLFGVYLGDLPLPFCKSLTGASNINKSASFVQWINEGMEGEFKDYYKDKDSKTNVLENQYSLRGLLSTLQLNEDELNKYESLGINGLNDKIKELFNVYLEHRLIVDMKLLDDQSFGLWDVLFDGKEDASDKLLDAVIKESQNENGPDYDKIDAMVIEFIKNIRDEDDVDSLVVDSVENRNDYMTEVMSQDQITQNISYLFSLGHTASFASILYKFDTPQDFINLGFSQENEKDITDLYDAISEKNSEQVKSLTSKLKDTFSNIFSENHSEYLKSTIPTGKFKYVNRGVAKHGIDLRTITDESKHYESATTTTADPTGKYSSLGLAYMSYLDKGALSGVTYTEFDESFKNKETIDTKKLIEELSNNPLINTGRKEDKENITTLQELLEGSDEVIYKMEDITKSYTYYTESGEKITQTVTYNLYMRPECQNPLIIPNSIHTESQTHDVNFDPHTAVEVSNVLPIVLAYDLFSSKSNGSQSTTTLTDNLGGTETTGSTAANGGSTITTGSFGSDNITNTVSQWVKSSSKSYGELSVESTVKAAAVVSAGRVINKEL